MMKKTTACAALIAFCLMLGTSVSLARKKKHEAKEGTVKEHYMATTGDSNNLSISIENYTTGADMSGFAQVFAKGGEDALHRALEKNKMGSFYFSNSNGPTQPLVIVSRSSTPSGTNLDMLGIAPAAISVTIHGNDLPYMQGYGRSRYPYTYIHLQLNSNSKGSGYLYLFAKLTFSKQGQVKIDSDPNYPGEKLFTVHRLKN